MYAELMGNYKKQGIKSLCDNKLKKDIIDFVLSPFLFIRQVPYLNKEEYSHLGEEPIECYISSAYYASHWMTRFMHLAVVDMYDGFKAIMLGYDYSITLKHNIRTKAQLIKEKKKMGATAFAMEYENVMIGQGEDAFYPHEMLDKCQVLEKITYPNNFVKIEGDKNKFAIKKQAGEKRVLSVDIAMVENKNKNDNTVLTFIRALPSGEVYERKVPYIEAFAGKNTDVQACRIKELFFDFECDYIVLDTQNAGLSVFDALGRVTYSKDRDTEYPAFTCFNDDKVAERIKNKDALPVVFSYKGQAEINQQMHYAMRDVIQAGLLKLPVNSVKAKDYLEAKDFYIKEPNPKFLARYELPYNQVDLLIKEMVSLMIAFSGKYLALVEPSTGTKDRYVSLAMGNYFIKTWLDKELTKTEEDEVDWSDMPMCSSDVSYLF